MWGGVVRNCNETTDRAGDGQGDKKNGVAYRVDLSYHKIPC